MELQISYYAVIPATVRYDSKLPPNAKLLYGEITALCNKEGYCWASNNYFAKLYNVSTRSISAWINALCQRGYIESKVIRKKQSKEVEVRYITIREATLWKKSSDPMEENFIPYRKNLPYPIEENFQENITSINTTKNTTSNKKKERKSNGYDGILSSIEDTSLREIYVEFLKMRQMKKDPMTDYALTLLIKKVEKAFPDDVEAQKALLNESIEKGWKSVYPKKEGEKNGVHEADRPTGIQAAGIIRL